jgi:hypothetical protein
MQHVNALKIPTVETFFTGFGSRSAAIVLIAGVAAGTCGWRDGRALQTACRLHSAEMRGSWSSHTAAKKEMIDTYNDARYLQEEPERQQEVLEAVLEAQAMRTTATPYPGHRPHSTIWRVQRGG